MTIRFVEEELLAMYSSMKKDEDGWVSSPRLIKDVAEKLKCSEIGVRIRFFKMHDFEHRHGWAKYRNFTQAKTGDSDIKFTKDEILAQQTERNDVLDDAVEFLGLLPMGEDIENILSKIAQARAQLLDGVDEIYLEVLRLIKERYRWQPL